MPVEATLSWMTPSISLLSAFVPPSVSVRVPVTPLMALLKFVAVKVSAPVPLLAIVIIPPSYGVGFLVPYCLLVYLLAFLHGVAKQRQTRHVHRHYIGDPWLTIGHPSRRLGEWLLGWLLVGLFFLFSNTLGLLHLVSLICAAIGQDLMEAREKRILQQMRDSQLEAEYYSNRLKDL